jgi:protein-tyrosine kinase
MSMEPINNKLSLNLIAHLDPKSPAAEAYRSLRTSLAFTGVDGGLKVMVVTSPGPGDGKTTTACNLAISLAQSGKRVLLMDADLRKPSIAHNFNLANTVGLTHLLTGEENMDSTLRQPTGMENLFVLTNGRIPPNPAELLGSRKMLVLIATLKERFDMVVIDAPPAAHLTDATILGSISDGALLVISAGESHIESTRLAKKKLETAQVHILGTVFTKMPVKGHGSYYYYYAG